MTDTLPSDSAVDSVRASACRSAARATRGFMPDDEGEALLLAALRAGRCAPPDTAPATFVEIGAWCGKSGLYIGAAAETTGAVLFSIDHHRGSEENQAGWDHHESDLVDPDLGRIDTLLHWRQAVSAADLEHSVIGVVGDSPTVAARWRQPLAFCFIDGGHGEEPAWADFRGWSPTSASGDGWPSTTCFPTRPTGADRHTRSTARRSNRANTSMTALAAACVSCAGWRRLPAEQHSPEQFRPLAVSVSSEVPSLYAAQMRRFGATGILVIVVVTVLSVSVGASGADETASSRDVKATGSPLRVLPVVSCPTSYGAGNGSGPFVPLQLPTTTSTRGLRFYSNGLITVLGPRGWACGALVAADGGQSLAVYPPGKPDYSTHPAPKGAAVIEVLDDYTGHLPGAEVVCALFPRSAAALEVRTGGLPCQVPAGERTTAVTADVVRFTDPANITGSGAASGGRLTSSGAAVYPQVRSASSSVDVSKLSCTLPTKSASLCSGVLDDYLVRNPPSYPGMPSG